MCRLSSFCHTGIGEGRRPGKWGASNPRSFSWGTYCDPFVWGLYFAGQVSRRPAVAQALVLYCPLGDVATFVLRLPTTWYPFCLPGGLLDLCPLVGPLQALTGSMQPPRHRYPPLLVTMPFKVWERTRRSRCGWPWRSGVQSPSHRAAGECCDSSSVGVRDGGTAKHSGTGRSY